MNGRNLAATAYRELIRRILEGELKPGDTLQETRLCADLDMSRTPVREAIARIRSEGLAEQEGRFMRVRRISPEEVAEIFFLRRTLEPGAIRAATGRVPPAQIAALEADIRGLMRKGPGDDDLQWHIDQSFHATIAMAAGNAAAAKVIQEHLAMLSAMRDGRRDAAAELMGAHLDHARDAIFEHLDAVQTSSDERVL